MRPSFVVGGDVTDAGTGAQWTGSDLLVVEADESDGTHLELPLFGSILTNIEVDHLDHYGSFDAIVDSFDRYLSQIAGPKVLCSDDPRCADLARTHGAVTYGLGEGADFRATDVAPSGGSFRFDVAHQGALLGHVDLPLRGIHNVLNAVGVVAMATELGVPFPAIASALGRFGGVARRFDIRGRDGQATFVDDYAHLPSEIAAVLAAARGSGDQWQRVIAVFQPNRFNRMSEISRDYADAFVDADVVVLTEIYSSGTTPIPGVTGQLVVDAVLEAHPDRAGGLAAPARRHDLVPGRRGRAGRRLHLDGVRRHRDAPGRGDGPSRNPAPRRRAPAVDDGCVRRPMSDGRPTTDASSELRRQQVAWPGNAMSGLIERVDIAAQVLGEIATRDAPLGALTTYKVGGRAALLVKPGTVADLVLVAEAREASGLPVLVVGRGSNMLVADEGFPGIAVWVPSMVGDLEVGDSTRVRGGAGMALPVVSRRLAAMGLRGFEWAVGVPGSIGGAVRMNAGGHGSDIAACLVEAEIFDLRTATVSTRPVESLGLRFRASDLTDDDVVVAGTIHVVPGDREEAEAELAEIVRWRRENQPGGQNAGSVFVNPVPGEVSAGMLIDGLGLRGFSIGTAGVSEKHANFIQGSDGGSAGDVRSVMEYVRERVAAETGFRLRSEVRLIGFGDPDETSAA